MYKQILKTIRDLSRSRGRRVSLAHTNLYFRWLAKKGDLTMEFESQKQELAENLALVYNISVEEALIKLGQVFQAFSVVIRETTIIDAFDLEVITNGNQNFTSRS